MSSWTLVTARGFTVCTPSDWQGGGDGRRKGRSSISWGTGTPPQQRVPYTRAVVARAGQRPPPAEPPPGTDVRRFTEDIGGRIANLYRNRFDNTYYVGAVWESQGVWVTGESPDSDAADLMLNIARTVRFVSK